MHDTLCINLKIEFLSQGLVTIRSVSLQQIYGYRNLEGIAWICNQMYLMMFINRHIHRRMYPQEYVILLKNTHNITIHFWKPEFCFSSRNISYTPSC